MTDPPVPASRIAVVVRSGEETCTVLWDGQPTKIAFAPFFPQPRVERVLPGHLVAVLDDVIVWRWFDAVVVDAAGGLVRLWEPAHGEVAAQPRDNGAGYAAGRRAYLSAGLPGAEWWVEGEARGSSADAVVDVAAVLDFLAGHGLISRPVAPL